jgi:hypothetical protein
MFRGAALLVFLLLAIGRAYAAEPVDVMVVQGAGSAVDLFSLRLVAELRADGFSTRTLPFADDPLDAAGRAQLAKAAVRCLPSGRGVEVWLDERANGRPMVRQMVVDERPGVPDVNMVVLQTTELLRAGLRGLPLQASSPPLPLSPKPMEVYPSWSIGTGFGMHNQWGAFPAQPVLRVEGSLTPPSGFGLDFMLQGPWHSSDLASPEGTTKATPWTVALGAHMTRSTKHFFAQLGAGLQGQYWMLQGDTFATLLGQRKDVLNAGAYSRARVGVVVASWIRLGIELLGAENLSETKISHAQRYVGSLERFGLTGLVVVEAVSK